MKKPPNHLRKPAKKLWLEVMADYAIDDGAGLALLQTACEAYQRCDEARRLIRREAAVIVDRFGQPKPHPAVAIERDARAQLIAALRALKLAPGGDI
jgi:P27 family predicted phage terminase small subunit